MRGAREDTYREVWSEVYDRAPGSAVSVRELRQLRGAPCRMSIHRAMRIAELAGVVKRVSGTSSWSVWIRQPWPVLTITGLAGKGVTLTQALNFLRALESAGYLECDKGGRYRPKE